LRHLRSRGFLGFQIKAAMRNIPIKDRLEWPRKSESVCGYVCSQNLFLILVEFAYHTSNKPLLC
jgi:hypothetical protein